MLRSRLQSHVQLISLPQLLGAFDGTSSCCLAPIPAAVAAVTPSSTADADRGIHLQHVRAYAAEVKPSADAADPAAQTGNEVAQAAHELGLDAVPFEQLKAMMDPALNRPPRDSELVASPLPAKQRQLTYPDLPGYKTFVDALVTSPITYRDHLTNAPALDASQWVEAHFKDAGYTMEPRGPFYVWRAWAAAHLPRQQYETLLCVNEVMGDESTRSAFVKQAQHELARLWDWQQRRAALGLPPDVSPAAAAAAASSRSPSSSAASILDVKQPDAAPTAAAAAEPETPETAAAAAAAAAVADAAVANARAAAAAVAAAAADGQRFRPLEVVGSESDDELLRVASAAVLSSDEASDAEGSSSAEDLEVAAAAAAVDMANKSLFEVLESSGALDPYEPATAAEGTEAAAAAEAEAAAASTTDPDALLDDISSGGSSTDSPAAAAAAWLPDSAPSVVDTGKSMSHEGSYHGASVRKRMSSAAERKAALDLVRMKLERGKDTARKGKFVRLAGVSLREYQPVVQDGDIFLPTRPLGNPHVAAALSDPNQTQPVNPDKVVDQAKWVVRQAKKAASANRSSGGVPGLNPQGKGSTGIENLATWTSMPLLDRAVLREESLRQAAEKLAAKPQADKRWQLQQDGYLFDLQQRPPTTAFDLLTGYLEVKYADVLLQKDAVQTLNRQMALHTLQSSGGFASEVLEQPPTALTAAKTLSPAEREAVCSALDELLESKQYGQYKEAVMQLYCDGLVSWDELQQCWAAAEAGEQLAAAAEAPVSIADDREQLFRVLSGQQQLPSTALRLNSSSSGSSGDGSPAVTAAAAAAAARQAWEQAGQTLQQSWSDGSSGSQQAVQAVSYEEAERTWQQLLHLAGQPDGPRFDQVLLAGSSGGSDALQQQLRHLQQSLQRACRGLEEAHLQDLSGLVSSSSSSSSSPGLAVDDLQQMQHVFAAPPSLQDILQQRWQQVSDQELVQEASSTSAPTWAQMWELLEQVTSHHQQQQQQQAGGAAAADDAALMFDKYLKEADSVPLTPPPYPGARRLLRWEQRLMLHAASGQVVMPAELKVKLAVSAAELQQEAGLSDAALQYLLAVARNRYNPSSGDLTIACDRYPTREENRRWCLEVLHRLLQAAQGKHPSDSFWVDSSVVGVPAGNPMLPTPAAAV